ncbi:MAG TPA: hypothetical protein VIB47_14105 [Dehalococcoidia bacterium]
MTVVQNVPDVAVTHYGESFSGRILGCGGGTYASDDAGIIAVGSERNKEWPCGTLMRVCGPGGCLLGQRQDSCGGCDAYHVDLSEEGLYLVCGPGSGVCRASLEVVARTSAGPPAAACEAFDGLLVSGAAAAPQGGGLTAFAVLAQRALEDRTAELLDITANGPATTTVCTVFSR